MTKVCNVFTPQCVRDLIKTDSSIVCNELQGIDYQDIDLVDGKSEVINGDGLLLLPGLLDPHVHFRVPGMEHKEDWVTGSKAAVRGGYTMVFDMPNTIPATNTQERLQQKMALIDEQIGQAGLPLSYRLFFGADKQNFHQISLVHEQIVGIKVFMGSSTGDLLLDDLSSLHAIYALAKSFDLIIALHAEDELTIRDNAKRFAEETDFSYHSKIRSPEAAKKAVELVIELSELYQVTSYILHISTKDELELLRAAKQRRVPVHAETCPHYLFMDDSVYARLHGRAKMNPPLRDASHRQYLWQAVIDGTIDTIASDHAPHTLGEKGAPLCRCPSGIPGIETTLPLLLTAYTQGKLSLERILELAYLNPRRIFGIRGNPGLVLVDMANSRILKDEDLATKVKWSPYAGMELIGFPRYVYKDNCLYALD